MTSEVHTEGPKEPENSRDPEDALADDARVDEYEYEEMTRDDRYERS